MGSTILRTAALALATLLLVPGARSFAQHTVLVATVGNDTVAVDRFTRTAETIEGVVLLRHPRPHVMLYKATLAPPDGRFSNVEYSWRDVAGTETARALVTFGVDSIRSELKEAGRTGRASSAAATVTAVPLPPDPHTRFALALIEHAAIVSFVRPTATARELEWITIGSTRLARHRSRLVSGDTVELGHANGPVRAQLNPEARVVWMTLGSGPAAISVTVAEKDVDIPKLLASFAARDTLRIRSR